MENYIYPGTVLNPNTLRIAEITKALRANGGRCICVGVNPEAPDNTKCPCVSYRENGKCLCGKFVPKSLSKPVISAPDINSDTLTATITKSSALYELRLENLIGRKCIILEELTSYERTNKGYMVRLIGGKYMGEDTWFVPSTSIQKY